MPRRFLPAWKVVGPIAAFLALFLAGVLPPWVLVALLFVGVLASIHHAEVVAHRAGEPFGTLILAVAITVIEVGMILSLMLASPTTTTELARDTIFAALMIICSGVIGVCLFAGGLRHREQVYRIEGASSALIALLVLASLTLVLPRFTTSTTEPTYTPSQLIVISLISLVMWVTFVLIQTGRHRDYFLPDEDPQNRKKHREPPPKSQAIQSLALLIISLVSVVGLAKALSKPMESALTSMNAPKPVLGAIIALIVLLPETGAAVRAARANRLQSSLNLALGSGMASIGLTIPVVAIASLALGIPLQLGLAPKEMVLLMLTFAVNAVTLMIGRTNILLGVVHLALFATFVLTTLIP